MAAAEFEEIGRRLRASGFGGLRLRLQRFRAPSEKSPASFARGCHRGFSAAAPSAPPEVDRSLVKMIAFSSLTAGGRGRAGAWPPNGSTGRRQARFLGLQALIASSRALRVARLAQRGADRVPHHVPTHTCVSRRAGGSLLLALPPPCATAPRPLRPRYMTSITDSGAKDAQHVPSDSLKFRWTAQW